MNYVEVTLEIKPKIPYAEIITSDLADLGFESFVETEAGLSAFIQGAIFSQDKLDALLAAYRDVVVTQHVHNIEQQNWNAAWESDYQPTEVENLCLIRAPFHKPQREFRQEVLISPQMSFGTGHHETTWLMVKHLFDLDLKDKKVADIGCGTGVLAILSEKLGATNIAAVDVDEWSYKNTLDNVALNKCEKISVTHGDVSVLEMISDFDVVLANINKNVLLEYMPVFSKRLNLNGTLFLSGFFDVDAEELIEAGKKYDFEFVVQKNKNHWAFLHLQKIR